MECGKEKVGGKRCSRAPYFIKYRYDRRNTRYLSSRRAYNVYNAAWRAMERAWGFGKEHGLKIHTIAFIFALVFLLAPVFNAQAREEAWEEEVIFEARNRINMLITGLDAPFALREKFVEELVGLAKGNLRPILMRQLRASFLEPNTQISEGIIEIYSRINDPAVIPTLEEELLYNPALDLRMSIILHLPLFAVRQEKERLELMNLLEGAKRHLPDNLVAALRVLPLSPATDEYDVTLDEDIIGRIQSALSWQLEPVEAVIEYGLEKRNQNRAIDMLKHLLGVDLGHSRNTWLEFWRSRGRTFASPVQEEILETQINACRMLGFMGAEGTPQLRQHIRWVMQTPYNTARQAALQMLRDITAYGVELAPQLEKRLARPQVGQPEQLWITRRNENTNQLKELVYEVASRYLGDDYADIRLALLECLGATGDPRAAEYIAQALRIDGQSHTLRLYAAAALGRTGGAEAVQLLEQMATFRGIAVGTELRIAEYQRVRAAFAALGEILGRTEGGRLVSRDPAASAKAFEFLLNNLTDERPFPGAPANSLAATVQEVARQTLRTSFGNSEASFDPQRWREIHTALSAGS